MTIQSIIKNFQVNVLGIPGREEPKPLGLRGFFAGGGTQRMQIATGEMADAKSEEEYRAAVQKVKEVWDEYLRADAEDFLMSGGMTNAAPPTKSVYHICRNWRKLTT